MIACALTYPLDLVRTRLAAQTTTKYYDGLAHALFVIARDEGPRGLYRGLPPTLVGVGPSLGINFAAYETFKNLAAPREENLNLPPGVSSLVCGSRRGRERDGDVPARSRAAEAADAVRAGQGAGVRRGVQGHLAIGRTGGILPGHRPGVRQGRAGGEHHIRHLRTAQEEHRGRHGEALASETGKRSEEGAGRKRGSASRNGNDRFRVADARARGIRRSVLSASSFSSRGAARDVIGKKRSSVHHSHRLPHPLTALFSPRPRFPRSP